MSTQNRRQPVQSSTTHLGTFVDVSQRSIVRFYGNDALDLLHRISTNDIASLKSGEVNQTVLTNEKGKIVDVVSVLKTSTDSLLLVGQTKGGEQLRQWLEKYIIMEKAAVENLTASYAHYIVYRMNPAEAPELLRHEKGKYRSLTNHDDGIIVFDETWTDASLCHIVAPKESQQIVESMLRNHTMISSSKSDFESYRIMCGIPAHPSELSLDFNPMEARLINLISFTKGCYIGQEVIARLDTYKKVQKQLVRFRLGALPNKLPVPCYSEQQEVGIITSAVWEGHVVFALGYLKTTFSENQPLYFMNGTEKITLTVESYNR